MSRQVGSWGRRCKRGAPYLLVVLLGAPRLLVVLFILYLTKSAVLESSGGQREDNRFNIKEVTCSCAGNSTKMEIKQIRKRACAAITLNSSANSRTREFAARTSTDLTFSWRFKGHERQSEFVLKFERDPSKKNSRPRCFLVPGCNKYITCSAKSTRKGIKVTVLPSRFRNTSLKTRQGADKARIFKDSKNKADRKNKDRKNKQKSVRSITQDCNKWTPQLNWTVNGRDVTFSYSPINYAADMIILELTQNYMVELSRNVSYNVQEIVFPDVPPGNYSVEIQPQGVHCSKDRRAFTHSDMLIIPQPSARSLTGTKPIINIHPPSITEKPCSQWDPNVEAALYINKGVAMVQVKYKPANPSANEIHIVLEKNDTHTQVEKILKSSETWTSFTNVTPGAYNVLVGSTCTDCKDFHQTDRLCHTPYRSRNLIVVPPKSPEDVDSTPGDDTTGTIVRTAHSIGADSTSGHSTRPKTVPPSNKSSNSKKSYKDKESMGHLCRSCCDFCSSVCGRRSRRQTKSRTE